MKKRLFTAAICFVITLFIVGFTMADNSGQNPNNPGFTNTGSEAMNFAGNLIDPTPKPPRPKGPPPQQ